MTTIDVPCVCGHHETDSVTLRDALDFRQALTVRNSAIMAREEGSDAAELLAILTEQYLLAGVEAWTLLDAAGKPLPVSRATVRDHLLSHPVAAIAVGDAADGLYAEAVVLPLLRLAYSSSLPTPTGASTSRTNGASKKRRTRSSPSSTEPIPTGATGTTTRPPAGGSNS